LDARWQTLLAGGLRQRELHDRYQDDKSRYEVQLWSAGQPQWNSNRLERFLVDNPTSKVRPVSSLAQVCVCLSWSDNGSVQSMLVDGIFALVLNGSGTLISATDPATAAQADYSVVVLGMAPSERIAERRLMPQPRQLGNNPMPTLAQAAEIDRYWHLATAVGLESHEVLSGWTLVVMTTSFSEMSKHLWVSARSETLGHRMDIAICQTDLLNVGLSAADYGGGGEDACLFRAASGALFNLVGATKLMLAPRSAAGTDHGSAFSQPPIGDIDAMERALRSATAAYAVRPLYMTRMFLQTVVTETLKVPPLTTTQRCMIAGCEFFAAPALELCSSHATRDTSTLPRRASAVRG
jgi:hypothetical protein